MSLLFWNRRYDRFVWISWMRAITSFYIVSEATRVYQVSHSFKKDLRVDRLRSYHHTMVSFGYHGWRPVTNCLYISTTSSWQWGFQQCLPFSLTTLGGKQCRHTAIMEVISQVLMAHDMILQLVSICFAHMTMLYDPRISNGLSFIFHICRCKK